MSDLRLITDRPYGPHARQQFDVFAPDRADGCATVVCVHGGWFGGGHHHDLRSWAIQIAEKGYAAAPVSIRGLADVRSGTELVDDVCAAARKALDEAVTLGASPRSLILLGSGSGSLPALAAAAKLGEDRTLRVRGAIACGVTPTCQAWEGCPPPVARAVAQYAGHAAQAIDPLEIPAAALPPLLLVHGDQDQDVPAKLVQRLHMRAIEAGEDSQLAVLAGMGHQFIETTAGARAALDRVAAFLAERAVEPEAERPFAGRRA